MIADSENFVTHLECSLNGDHYEAGQLHNLSKAGKPLLVRYDLDRIAGLGQQGAIGRAPGGHVALSGILADSTGPKTLSAWVKFARRSLSAASSAGG